MDECVKSFHTKQDGLRTKLCALQDSLGAMKGRLHDEKSNRRKDMLDELLKCKRLENEIQEHNSLEKTIIGMSSRKHCPKRVVLLD